MRLGGKCLAILWWLSAFASRQVFLMVLENFGLQVLDQLVQVEAESRIHERAPQVVPELGLVLEERVFCSMFLQLCVKDFTANKFGFGSCVAAHDVSLAFLIKCPTVPRVSQVFSLVLKAGDGLRVATQRDFSAIPAPLVQNQGPTNLCPKNKRRSSRKKYNFIKGSLVGETSVLRTFRMSGKEVVKESVSQRKR